MTNPNIEQEQVMKPMCKHCKNDDISMLEITVNKSIREIYCEVCSKFTVQVCEPIKE
jgi:hypothetical protein